MCTNLRHWLWVALEQFTRVQQAAAAAEERVRRALDTAVTAHGVAALKTRESAAFAAAATLAEVRRAMVGPGRSHMSRYLNVFLE